MGCSLNKDPLKSPAFDVRDRPDRKSVHHDNKYFTQRQKQLIRQTWKRVSDRQVETGIEIFLKLFQLKPEAKRLFPFRDLEGEALLSNSLFRGHSIRFMFAIGSTVAHLDALDISCAPTFILLGRKHLWIGDFLSSGYLEAFIESVAYVFDDLLGENEHGDVYDAWQAVFKFVVGKMIEGYKLALEEAQRRRINSNSETEDNQTSKSTPHGYRKRSLQSDHDNHEVPATDDHGKEDTSNAYIKDVTEGKTSRIAKEPSKSGPAFNHGSSPSPSPDNSHDISHMACNEKQKDTFEAALTNGTSKASKCPYEHDRQELSATYSHTSDQTSPNSQNKINSEQNGQMDLVSETHSQYDNS